MLLCSLLLSLVKQTTTLSCFKFKTYSVLHARASSNNKLTQIWLNPWHDLSSNCQNRFRCSQSKKKVILHDSLHRTQNIEWCFLFYCFNRRLIFRNEAISDTSVLCWWDLQSVHSHYHHRTFRMQRKTILMKHNHLLNWKQLYFLLF